MPQFVPRYRHLLPAVASLVVAVVLLYPHFRDAVDPDGTSYLTLARRWASGDYTRAANAYWSPLGPWLTALGIRAGLVEIPAALLQNTLGALAFLAASLRLFSRFRLPAKTTRWLAAGLVGFLLYAVFAQWFDDLWSGVFLLAALNLLLHPDFTGRKALWGLYGACGALAYFAKAYSLPFFALSTAVCVWWVCCGRWKNWLSICAVSGGVALLLCLPWWMALHDHYGFWTAGTAGALNLSWGLLGHPIFVDGPESLLRPPYPGSLVFWEDPWLVNARTVHPWDSPQLAGQQVIRCGYFAVRLFWKAALVSPALPLLLLGSAAVLLRRKLRCSLSVPARILAAQMVLFPLGLLLVHSEARYLWYLVPVAMTLGALLLEGRKWQGGLLPAFALSFLTEAAVDLPELWHAGRAERVLAGKLVTAGLRGGFTDSEPMQPSYVFCCRVAYFSKVPYWANAAVYHQYSQVRAEMDRHRIPFVLTARPEVLKEFYPEERVRYADRKVTLLERTYPAPTH